MRKWADPRGGAEIKFAGDALGVHQVKRGGANVAVKCVIPTGAPVYQASSLRHRNAK